MILDKKIKIKSDKYKKYYESLGYIYINKYTEIDIKHLKKNSLKVINVYCDFCKTNKYIRFQDYMKVTNNQSEPYFCIKCKWLKINKTIKEKYGVENISQSNKVKEKKKQTCLSNYGVQNPSQSKIIKTRKEKTTFKNFGVNYSSQNNNIFNEILKSGLKIKYYRNTNLFYQGSYEKHFLETYYDKLKIENGFSIEYNINNKRHFYHPDF